MGRILPRLRAVLSGRARDREVTAAQLRRRRLITALTVVLGTLTLGVSLRIPAGSVWFYPATLVLASVWALGALASGPLRLGRVDALVGAGPAPRPVLAPLAVGLLLAGGFVLGALVVREVPYAGDRVAGVLDYAGEGSLPLVLAVTAVNGVAEELFFRGALYAAVPRRRVLVTTVAYTIATLATGNVMLTLAAAILGVVVGLERRATGGVLGPMITHVSWSVTMVLTLPPLFS